jgi:hypothetical protein
MKLAVRADVELQSIVSTVKFSMKVRRKICVGPIGRIVFAHKSHHIRIRSITFPIPPYPRFQLPCAMVETERNTYHSDATDGTLNTPQWMNMPILLSSYHLGNGRLSRDGQSGVYCCTVTGRREQKTPRTDIHAKNGDILLPI